MNYSIYADLYFSTVGKHNFLNPQGSKFFNRPPLAPPNFNASKGR